MDPDTKEITPVDYMGVKCVSFGFAGQGSAIMRGPMVSGLIQQLVLTAKWGELDYLIVDFPPGTGVRDQPCLQQVEWCRHLRLWVFFVGGRRPSMAGNKYC